MRQKSFYKFRCKLRRKLRKSIIRPVMRQVYTLHYKCLAPDDKIIWINPWMDIDGFFQATREIIFEGQIDGGNWEKHTYNVKDEDCSTREEFEKRILKVPRFGAKFKGLIERYKEKRPWRDTALFTEWYLQDLDDVLKKRRCRNLAELEQHYENRYDKLFEDIKQYGVVPAGSQPGISPLYVCIGQEGQIFHYEGNHRLFIAMILGIEKLPYRVLRRHKEWQKKREILLGNGNMLSIIYDRYANHPDIAGELKVANTLHI